MKRFWRCRVRTMEETALGYFSKTIPLEDEKNCTHTYVNTLFIIHENISTKHNHEDFILILYARGHEHVWTWRFNSGRGLSE